MKRHLRYQLIIRLGLCSLLFLGFNPKKSYAQSRAELENQRFELIEKIETATELLNRNASVQQTTLKDINTMNKRVKNRKALIDNYGKELELVKANLRSNEVENSYLVSRLDTVKTRYYNLLNEAYRYNLSYNKWAFILNAKSINDSFLRWQYLKQYKAYCVESYNYLLETQEEVNESTAELNELITSRRKLLEEEEMQLALIEEEKRDLNDKLKVLQNDEAQLNIDLAVIRKQRENLNQAIESRIIASLKGEEVAVAVVGKAGEFSEKKKKLPWPVTNGNVVAGFGKQRHPNFKEIMITNNGIDVSCSTGSFAYAVHPGTIVSIDQVVGYENIVIVQHGNYYTVYSKLEKVLVNKGDSVNKGDQIGLIYLNEQGETVLHFEIWEGKQKQNPSLWLKRNI